MEISLSENFYGIEEKYKDTPIITTGYLNYVKEKVLGVSTSKGVALALNGINCVGDFAKYSNIQKSVEDLAKDLKAPEVTIKGTVKEIKDEVLILEPCILVDLKK